MSRAQAVVTSGGLGPTIDDATRQGIARAVERELVFVPELWEQIQYRFSQYGRTPTENNRRQAFIPAGATTIPNPVGTAPAFSLQVGDTTLYALPGVPGEMKSLLHDAVVPDLRRKLGLEGLIKSRVLRTAGVGESALDSSIADLQALANPTVGLSAHPASVDVRITAKARTEAEAENMLSEIELEISRRLGTDIYGKDQDTLGGILGRLLDARQLTVCGVEAGLKGRLASHLMACGPACLGVLVLTESSASSVESQLEQMRSERNASIALGVSLSRSEMSHQVAITLSSQKGVERRQNRYGGPPSSAPAWAATLAADVLRRALLDIPLRPR